MSIIIAFVIGLICGVILLVLLDRDDARDNRTGHRAATAQEGADMPGIPQPLHQPGAAVWLQPEEATTPEPSPDAMGASELDLAVRLDETVKLFNSLTAQAIDRGLGVAMKLEPPMTEFFEVDDMPGREELKAILFRPFRVMGPSRT